MAGTGHSYEVSNPTEASRYAFSLKLKARERGLDTAETWLGTRHFTKFLTSEAFTFRLKPAHVTNSSNPDEKRQHILAKIVAGGEVRRFDPDLFAELGPDISHILDWVEELKTTGSPTYRKIARMETPVLVAKADAWLRNLNSKKLISEGTIAPILAISDGLKWFELKDAEALQWEGTLMSHCVGSDGYARSLAHGKTRIFSLRKDVHKPILTVEVRVGDDGVSLVQIQKNANGGLPIAHCEAAVALLNAIGARDGHNAARRYALCVENGEWATIFDTWKPGEFHGRKVLGDGRNILFMCVTDVVKPLALMSTPVGLTPDLWDETEFDPSQVRLTSADDSHPHYLDQVELCAIANAVSKGGRAREYWGLQVSWMGINDNGEFVPHIDMLDRVEMTEGFYYTRTLGTQGKPEYFLPHSNDPARIIMTAKEKKHWLEAHVNAGQRVSRAETPRALAFLTATKTRFLDRDADPASRNATTEFMQVSQAMFVQDIDQWRSFAADMTETTTKGAAGKWQETDYLLRYIPGTYSSVDIYIKDQAVSHVSGTLVGEADLIEIARKLREKRITSDKFLLLSLFSSDRVSALFERNGKWTWLTEKNFARRAKETIDGIDKKQGSVSGIVLSGLLSIASFLLKKASSRTRETLSALKSRLLAAWFTHTASFNGDRFRRAHILPSFGPQVDYPVMDRMVDLANLGFVIESKAEKAQFRKFLVALSDSYGKGRVHYFGEQEFVELLVAWHRHMPKKFFNKVSSSWLRVPSLSSPSEGVSRTLELLNNENTRNTRFREMVSNHAEQFLTDADYAAMNDDDLARGASLFLIIAKTRYLFGRHVEALARLVGELEARGVGDNTVRSDLEKHLAYLTKKEALPSLQAA
jgi:hypothetical protein